MELARKGGKLLKKEAKVKKEGKAFAKPQLRAERRAWDRKVERVLYDENKMVPAHEYSNGA